MFERFTDRARRVLVHAQEEARDLDHNFIGTEHILLGLLDEEDGAAAMALTALGITLPAARQKVEELVGRGSKSEQRSSPPFTPRAKKVLELSLREALKLGHKYIGTEHVLLGLVREGEGVGAQVLLLLGPGDLAAVRQQVIGTLSGLGASRWSVEPVPAEAAVPQGPRCRCGQALAETARYSTLATAAGPGEPDQGALSVTVLYCGLCGYTYGPIGGGGGAGVTGPIP